MQKEAKKPFSQVWIAFKADNSSSIAFFQHDSLAACAEVGMGMESKVANKVENPYLSGALVGREDRGRGGGSPDAAIPGSGSWEGSGACRSRGKFCLRL